MFVFGMFSETTSSIWFDCMLNIWLSQTASCLFVQHVPSRKGEFLWRGQRSICQGQTRGFKDLFTVSGGPLWVGREEGTFFLNSCISDALRLNSKVWLIFWQNASRVPRLTKKMQLILMEWYKRKVGIMANYQSYLIQAICRHFFLKEKESKRVREVCREYVWDSQIIEDVFHRARKTPERNPWSQVSRRDNFTIFVMPNKLSELRQR